MIEAKEFSRELLDQLSDQAIVFVSSECWDDFVNWEIDPAMCADTPEELEEIYKNIPLPPTLYNLLRETGCYTSLGCYKNNIIMCLRGLPCNTFIICDYTSVTEGITLERGKRAY